MKNILVVIIIAVSGSGGIYGIEGFGWRQRRDRSNRLKGNAIFYLDRNKSDRLGS